MTLRIAFKRLAASGLTALVAMLSLTEAAHASTPLKCVDVFTGARALSLDQTRFGDLTSEEIASIQQIVDSTNLPLVVVGSAAEGRRRNPLKPIHIGRAPWERSDINYAFPTRNPVEHALVMHEVYAGYLKPIYAQLPSFASQSVLIVSEVDASKVRIWFTPGTAPRRIEPGEPNDPTVPFPYPIENKEVAIKTVRVLTRVAERHLGDRDLFSRHDSARAKAMEEKANELFAVVKKLNQEWDIPENLPPEPFIPLNLR